VTSHRSLIVAVEDDPSAAVAAKLVRLYRKDLSVSRTIVTRGYGKLKTHAVAYNDASRYTPFLLLTDLDRGECPPGLVESWLGGQPLVPGFLFRVAVREIEAWLLADREGASRFLGVDVSTIPSSPEELDDPKRTLVRLAERCRTRVLRESLVPAPRSTAQVGSRYVAAISEFIEKTWSPSRARRSAPSLDSAIRALQSFGRRRRRSSRT